MEKKKNGRGHHGRYHRWSYRLRCQKREDAPSNPPGGSAPWPVPAAVPWPEVPPRATRWYRPTMAVSTRLVPPRATSPPASTPARLSWPVVPGQLCRYYRAGHPRAPLLAVSTGPAWSVLPAPPYSRAQHPLLPARSVLHASRPGGSTVGAGQY
jgi:hypothetical protein